ncbi:MAG: RNA-binding protein [Gammaproteobacteria bacterium]|nr:RNA-binding protein [Gammaproteobacteria bacterium]
MKTMFVGNLAPETREDEIQELFSHYGTVRGVKLVIDVFSGTCRGFGFVEMEGHEARAAMAGLDGSPFKDRALRVREEREKAGHRRRGGRRR